MCAAALNEPLVLASWMRSRVKKWLEIEVYISHRDVIRNMGPRSFTALTGSKWVSVLGIRWVLQAKPLNNLTCGYPSTHESSRNETSKSSQFDPKQSLVPGGVLNATWLLILSLTNLPLHQF